MDVIKFLALCLVVIFIPILIIGGCEGDEESLERRAETWLNNNKQRVTSIMYIYDPRVDICYAVYRLGYREGTMTTVPYEKVKDYAYVIDYDMGWDEERWEAYHRAKKGVFK